MLRIALDDLAQNFFGFVKLAWRASFSACLINCFASLPAVWLALSFAAASIAKTVVSKQTDSQRTNFFFWKGIRKTFFRKSPYFIKSSFPARRENSI
jgi:hypothetical protein